MGVKDLHSVTVKFPGDLTIGAILEAFFRSHVDKKSFILQDGQFILENGNLLHKLLAFDSQLLVHDNIFDDNVCEVFPVCVQLVESAGYRFL